jgi:oligoendopeptidase F
VDTWNLNDICKPDEQGRLVKELKCQAESFKRYRRILQSRCSVSDFMRILRKEEQLSILAGRLSARAGLMLAEDTSDSKRIGQEAEMSRICAEASNDTLFFGLWFRDLTDPEASKYIEAAGAYRYPLERIRAFREHTLSEKEERVINIKELTGSDALTRLYDLATGRFRFRLAGRSLNFEEASKYKSDRRRRLRKAAYDATLCRYGSEGPLLGEIYRSLVNDCRQEDVGLRGFHSTFRAVNLGNDLPDQIVDDLLGSVANNRRVFQRYFRLKAKLCGIRRMDRYDIYAPYRQTRKRFTYRDSVKTVLETYREFDESMYLAARQIFDKRHIHVAAGGNKQSGAFCHSAVMGTTPYILLNHKDKLEDVFTLMHEVGHGIHNILAAGQTELTYRACLPLAETASLFGEMLLSQRMLTQASDDVKTSLLVRLLDAQYASICRQAYFVIFERSAHDMIAQGATVEDLDKLYLGNLRQQFGKSVSVPDVFRHEWKSIPHIFHSPYYCYSYSFGSLLVLALYRSFLQEGDGFKPRYLRILSQGGSNDPSSILAEAGIDLRKKAFWQGGFDQISLELKSLGELVA